MWNKRYDVPEYVYGKEPNRFLAESVAQLPKGNVLCLAEGEGRNAVFLAQQGFDVSAVDSSSVGLKKAEKLAEEKGVHITCHLADLADFTIEPDSWDLIVSIFCHLPAPLRKNLLDRVVKGLKPGGTFILEAYTPQQLEYKTGGPKNLELLISLNDLKTELEGLKFQYSVEKVREINEGLFHKGLGAVVQVIARK